VFITKITPDQLTARPAPVPDLTSDVKTARQSQAEAAEHQHDGGGDERADRGDTGLQTAQRSPGASHES
jgi:hypothetical protein